MGHLIDSASNNHQRFVHGDAGQPGGEPRFFLEAVEMEENLVKRFLHNIFGILAIIHDSLRHGKNSAFVTNNQLFERPRIATLCGSHQHAVGVFIHIMSPKVCG